MGRSHQITPRLLIEWESGLEGKPTFYLIAETDEQVEQLQKIFDRITQRQGGEHKAEAE